MSLAYSLKKFTFINNFSMSDWLFFKIRFPPPKSEYVHRNHFAPDIYTQFPKQNNKLFHTIFFPFPSKTPFSLLYPMDKLSKKAAFN